MTVYALNKSKKQRMCFNPLKIKVVVEKDPKNALGGLWLGDDISFEEMESTSDVLAQYTDIDHLIQAQVDFIEPKDVSVNSILDQLTNLAQTGVQTIRERKIESLPQLKDSIEKLRQDVSPIAEKLKDFAKNNSVILQDGVSSVKDYLGKNKKEDKPQASSLDIDVPNKPQADTNAKTQFNSLLDKLGKFMEAKTSADPKTSVELDTSISNKTNSSENNTQASTASNVKSSVRYEDLPTCMFTSMNLGKPLKFAIVKGYSEKYMGISFEIDSKQLIVVSNEGEKIVEDFELSQYMKLIEIFNTTNTVDSYLDSLLTAKV